MLVDPLQHVTSRAIARPALGTAAAITAIVLTHAAVDLVSGTVSALLPTLRDRFELSSATTGALVATVSVSTSLSQPLVGRIADRVGARRMAASGAVLCSALLSLLGPAPSLWIVFALIVVGGLGSAGFHPAAVVMARRAMPDRGQLAVSLFSAGGMIGLAAGPLVVLLIAAHAGMGFTPALMIPGLALGAALWRYLPDDDRAPHHVTRAGTGELLRGPVGRLAIAAALSGLAVTTFGAGLPLWLHDTGPVSGRSASIGLTLALFNTGAALGGLLVGWAVSRVVPARLALISLLAAAPVLLVMLVAQPGSAAFYGGALASGILAHAATPLLVVAAQELAPSAVTAATGMVMGFASGAAGLAFIGVGALCDAVGLRTGLAVGFSAVIPAALIARQALAGRGTTDTPQLLLAAACGCVACSCVAAERASAGCGCSHDVDACCCVRAADSSPHRS